MNIEIEEYNIDKIKEHCIKAGFQEELINERFLSGFINGAIEIYFKSIVKEDK